MSKAKSNIDVTFPKETLKKLRDHLRGDKPLGNAEAVKLTKEVIDYGIEEMDAGIPLPVGSTYANKRIDTTEKLAECIDDCLKDEQNGKNAPKGAGEARTIPWRAMLPILLQFLAKLLQQEPEPPPAPV